MSHESQDGEPCCGKCGAEITTGLMALDCPNGRACEFWTQEGEDLQREFDAARPLEWYADPRADE